MYLLLEFKRPTPGRLLLEFNLTKHLFLVDGIFQSNAVYLQPNGHGAKVSEGLDKPKILAEICTDGAPFDWNTLLRKWAAKRFRKEGLTRTESKRVSLDFISEGRKMWKFRKQ